MKKLNVKMLLYLGGSLLVLTAVVLALHYIQEGRIARALLWQAHRAQDEGRLPQAARYLSRYLEFEPGDLEGRANLGKLLASEQLATTVPGQLRALFVLEQVLTREPERHDLRRLLVPLAIRLQRFELAAEHIKRLREVGEADASVEEWAGQLHQAQNQPAEAAVCYRRAIQLEPHRIDCYVRLAELPFPRNDQRRPAEQEAERRQILDEMVANNPHSFQAYLARYQYRRARGDFQDGDKLAAAARDAARALELAPEEAEALLTAADLAQVKGELKQARELLQRGGQRHPTDPRFRLATVSLELQAGRRPEAIALLQEALKAANPQSKPLLQWTLANIHLDGGEVSAAESLIEELRKAGVGAHAVDYLRGRLLQRKGQWAEAAQLFERTRTQLLPLPDRADLVRQIDLYLGQCYEQMDEPALRLAAFSRLVEQLDQPFGSSRAPGGAGDYDRLVLKARLGHAESLAAVGRLDEALEQYRRVALLPGAPKSVFLEIARLALVRNLQRETKNWEEVEAALRQAEQASPRAVEVVLLRAELLATRGQFAEAEKVLLAARDKAPKEAQLWSALAALANRQQQPDRAMRLLQEAREQAGDSVTLRLARARQILTRPTRTALQDLNQLASGLEKFTSEEQGRLLRGLAETFFRLGDNRMAATLWQKLTELPRHRNDLRLRVLLFDLALQVGDETALDQILADISRIESGPGPFYHFCQGTRLISQARLGQHAALEEARVHLDAAATRKPDWPPLLLAKAELEELRGNADQAIALYRKSIELGNRNPRPVRQLVQLLCQRQRFEEADQEIRRLKKHMTLTADMQRLAADVSLRNQDPVRAVQLAQEAVSADSQDYRDHLWLGQLLAASNQQLEEAERRLRRAVELGGHAPETWVALIRFLAGRDRRQEAVAELDRAREKLPAEAAPLGLAQSYEALGQFEQAGEQFQSAVKARPQDSLTLRAAASFYLRAQRHVEAEPLLRRLLDSQLPALETDRKWARQGLALALASHPTDYRRFLEALNLLGLRIENGRIIEERKPAPEESGELTRTRARVLATQGRRFTRARAIALLEDLARRQALTVDDQFLLAQLYHAEPDWAKCRECLRILTSAPRPAAAHLAFAVQAYLAQGELGEAAACIEQLERLERTRAKEPGAFGSVELRSRLLEVRGQGHQAVELLKPFVQRPGARPEEALLLAGCLARQKRLSEALEICERCWSTCPPETVAAASVAVLRATPPPADLVARVESRLQAELAKAPRSKALLLHLADVKDMQGRYSESEKLYRQVLEQDPQNVVALNNLAWLLTQRPDQAHEALSLIDRAIDLLGPSAELLDTRAVVFLALGRPDRAIAELEDLIRDAPTAVRLFHLARAYHQAANLQLARAALRKAQASGLAPDQLHPTELVIFHRLTGELETQ